MEEYEFEEQPEETKYGSLEYDHDSEEGVVYLKPELLEEHTVIRLDILQDWIAALSSLYNAELKGGITNDEE
jgi:hypothetical protein